MKHRELVRGYCEEKGWTEDEIKSKDPAMETDWPKIKGTCGDQDLDLADIEFSIERYQK